MSRLSHVYILAGGLSQRFGSDKARASIGDTTAIEFQASQWRSLGFHVYAVSNRHQRYEDLGLETLFDETPNLGPVSGLITALKFQQTMFAEEFAYISNCDFLGQINLWIAPLLQHFQGNSQAFVYRSKFYQPFPGIYSTRCLPQAQILLKSGSASMQQLLRSIEPEVTPSDLPNAWQHWQFNTLEEFHTMLQDLANLPPSHQKENDTFP